MAKTGRKLRKKARKSKGRSQLPLSDSAIERLAWRIVNQLPQTKVENANEKCYCPKCGDYCIGYDGTDVWCYDCRFMKLNSCLKETTLVKRCKSCIGRSK
jgi:hypothetical protein